MLFAFGIILMNYLPKSKLTETKQPRFYLWLIIGLIFGFAPRYKQQLIVR